MPTYKPSATENILRLIGINTVHKTSDPTSADKNYGVPTLWVNDSSKQAFLLIFDDGNTITWVDIGDTSFPRNFDDFYDATTAPPGSPSTGDSYILSTDTPVDSGWTALSATNNDYVEYNGSSWDVFTPVVGQIDYSNDLSNFYIFDGTEWILLSGSISGLTYVTDSRPPNSSDNTYTVPTMWVDTTANAAYVCTDVTNSIATWLKLSDNQLGDAQNSVLSFAVSTDAPPTEVTGDRYILDTSGAPNAAWDGASQEDIVEFDGATWVATTPNEGMFSEVEDEDTVYIYTTSWVKMFAYTGASFAGDSGSAVPTSGGVTTIAGTAAQGIVTSGATNTLTITASDATTSQKGVLETATDAEAVAVTSTTTALTPSNMTALFAEPPAIGGTTPAGGEFTILNVDNVRINGNTIDTTNSNGNLNLIPNGTGEIATDERGYSVNPGSDTDANLITVGVTGSPKLFWDESEDGFGFSKPITVGENSESHTTYTLNGSSVTADISAHNDAASGLGGVTVDRHSDTASLGGHFIAIRSRGDHTTPTVIQDNDYLLRLIAAGYDGTDYAQSSEIRFSVDGTPGANDMPGRIVFLTSPDGTQVPVEAMRINEDQTITLANDLPVSEGGTGASTLTDHGVLVGSGTSAITALSVGTNGQLLVGSTGADPVFATAASSDGSITWATGAGTIGATVTAATTTQVGGLETATDVEAVAVTATDKIVTPGNLAAVFAEPPALGSTTPAAVTGTTGTFNDVDVDNVNINGNTVSTTDTNGNLTLAPDGTGIVLVDEIAASTTNSDLTIAANGTGDFVVETPGGSQALNIDPNGIMTRPLQPAFSAYQASTVTNITGDGSNYTIVCDTEIFDNNSDYDGTSTYTAPVSGPHLFSAAVNIQGTSASHVDGDYTINTSNRTFYILRLNPRAIAYSGGSRSGISSATVAEMDAADTAFTRLKVSGGTKVIDVGNNTSAFGGFLI